MREYSVLAVAAVAVTVAVEEAWLHTGLFRQRSYWLAMAIVVFFQCLVDGWLTKLSAPIVIYDPARISGWRFPWDVPVEDFLYGFALVTLTLLSWKRAGERVRQRQGRRLR